MPLMRDQPQSDPRPSGNAQDFTARRHQARVNHLEDPGRSLRASSPQYDSRTLPHKRNGSTDKANGVKTEPKKYALGAEEPIDAAMKFPVLTSLPPKPDKAGSHMARLPTSVPAHQGKAVSNPSAGHTQTKNNFSVFDDTQTLNTSSLDASDHEHDRNIVQRPQSYVAAQEQEHVRYHNRTAEGIPNVLARIRGLGQTDPNFKDTVNVGRELVHDRGFGTDLSTDSRNPEQFDEQYGGERRGSLDADNMPETPSRSRSAPIQNEIVAPVPRKGVVFSSSPHFMNQSPVTRSEDIAREETPEVPVSRSSSVQPSTRLAQRPQQNQSMPNSRLRQSQTLQPARFQNMAAHVSSTHMRDQKVSAPESDVPESSEDERPVNVTDKPPRPVVASYIDKKFLQGKKRSHGEIHYLDYDQSDLSKKSLAELQNEPFIKDPRESTEPQRDGLGNELSLSQILEKWSKMTDEALKFTFGSQTDEEWAQTGQWFVDSFQTDLNELMQIRLAQRKVALQFEHKIRERQREIEHHRAGLDNELRELQEGGSGLLKDRKMTSGSRSNTPMRRAH